MNKVRHKATKGRLAVLPLLLVLVSVEVGCCQVNLSGKPGLIYVPSAAFTEDGLLTVGVNYNPAKYALSETGKNAERVLFANLTILPRLDIGVSLLKPLATTQHPVIKDIGDRQLDVKYLLFKEKRFFPSVAVIMSSPFTIDASMLTHVVVGSKTVEWNGGWKTVLTAGVGSPYFVYRRASLYTNSNIFSSFKWQKKSEYLHDNHYLVGLFGGLQLDFRRKAGFMLEYDSQHLNAGVYANLFKRWNVQAGLLNFDRVAFGTAYSFALLKPSKRLEKLYGKDL